MNTAPSPPLGDDLRVVDPKLLRDWEYWEPLLAEGAEVIIRDIDELCHVLTVVAVAPSQRMKQMLVVLIDKNQMLTAWTIPELSQVGAVMSKSAADARRIAKGEP